MPNTPRSPRLLLLGALASLPLLVFATACGPSLSSLARETFFSGYDCPKKQITVTGGGGNTPYQASGCGKHASYSCHSENGGMGCEEVGRPPELAASSAAPVAPAPSGAPATPSATPPGQP